MPRNYSLFLTRRLLLLVVFNLMPAGSVLANTGNYANRAEVSEFIEEMVAEGFNQAQLTDLFAEAEYKQSIIDAISRPAERTLTWKQYQDIFLTDLRRKRGNQFMTENADALKAAEDKFGVPAEVVTAIIGVETMYGRIRGSYRVIDSLATLAFDYPPRSTFFRGELKHFLRLVREEGQDARDPTGSYAGAMGYGQFISSSYRSYAIDFDGDGTRDIWNNKTDAIGSVANYLFKHGWQRNELITVEVSSPTQVVEDVFNISLAPSSTVESMSNIGVRSRIEIDANTAVSPMVLDGKKGEEYWLGMQNFYVITRYNHSKLYAMAVFQLSEKLKASQS